MTFTYKTLQPSRPADHLILLTVLRGLFAWWVVGFHIREWIPSSGIFSQWLQGILALGYLGVDFFFVLSGFVIGRRYIREFNSLTFFGIYKFLYLRIARVYPLHLLLLLIMAADPLLQLTVAKSRAISAQYPLDYFFQSLVLIQNWGFFDELRWNVPAWSISTELLAYLAFPFVAFLLRKGQRMGLLTPILFGGLLLMAIALVYGSFGQANIGAMVTKLGAARCLLEFSLGCCIAQISTQLQKKESSLERLSLILAIAFILITLFGAWRELPNYYWVPGGVAVGILAISLFEKSHRIRVPKFLAAIGDYSYSTYLCHWIIKGWFIFADLHRSIPAITLVLFYCAVVFVASRFLFKAVEVPTQVWLRDRLILSGKSYN